jgi:type I restriction enzyme S subunit
MDELMKRCDELEVRQKDRAIRHKTLVASCLNAVTYPENPDPNFPAIHSLGEGGITHNASFSLLFSSPESIVELRKTILQLAVQGRIVHQDPKDPPARELLKEIDAEKQRLVKAEIIKNPKPLPPLKAAERPYQLPQGWEWVRLGEMGITQTGTTPPNMNHDNLGDFIPFVGPGDIKNGSINYSGRGLSEQGLAEGRLIEANSVLMVCIGGSIGKHAINERDISCNQQINTLTPYRPVPVKYIYDIMATIYFQNAIINHAGGSATPIINKQKWSFIPVPVPPLPEQHRIVARIDQLMVLCDTMEQQINAATSKQTEVLNAMMA